MTKLLIVYDDSAMRAVSCVHAYRPLTKSSTRKAQNMAIALALEHRPDAVLLDLMIPKFSGFELCQSFHALTYTSYVPIFVISHGW